MALHFTKEEFERRQQLTLTSMAERGLDALLMFKQESMYWLTGYDTFGYCFFQCLVLRADGEIVLLTRAPDLRQAQNTSIITDIRIWVDRDGATPADDLKDLLRRGGLEGKKLGIEYDATGLTAFRGKQVDTALDGFATAIDASDLIGKLRLVKSEAELVYVRRAAELGDLSLAAGIEATKAGADEGDILAAMQGAVFKGGGDYPGNPFIIGSGPDALLCRYKSGRRTLDARDQLTLEFAGVYRQYHACLMRTFVVGEPTERSLAMARGLRRGAARLRSSAATGNEDGGSVRCPCRSHGRPRHAASSIECLRLFPGHGLCALLDGLSDVLYRQSGRHRGWHGLFPPHDPHGQLIRSGHVPWTHLDHRRRQARNSVQGFARPRYPIGLLGRADLHCSPDDVSIPIKASSARKEGQIDWSPMGRRTQPLIRQLPSFWRCIM